MGGSHSRQKKKKNFTHRYKVKRGVGMENWHIGRQEPEGELEEIIGKDGIVRDTV